MWTSHSLLSTLLCAHTLYSPESVTSATERCSFSLFLHVHSLYLLVSLGHYTSQPGDRSQHEGGGGIDVLRRAEGQGGGRRRRRRRRGALPLRPEPRHLRQDAAAGPADERLPAGHEQLLQQAEGAGAHAAHAQEGHQGGDPAARHRLHLGPAGGAGRRAGEGRRGGVPHAHGHARPHAAHRPERGARQHLRGERLLRRQNHVPLKQQQQQQHQSDPSIVSSQHHRKREASKSEEELNKAAAAAAEDADGEGVTRDPRSTRQDNTLEERIVYMGMFEKPTPETTLRGPVSCPVLSGGPPPCVRGAGRRGRGLQ